MSEDRTRRKKVQKFTIGGKVKCTHAASPAYRTRHVYDVVKHPETGGPAIKARDGFLDLPSLVVSTFDPVNEKEAERLRLVSELEALQ